MKKIVFGICLIIFLSGNVSAKSAEGVTVETLVKTESSWNGKALPDYAEGQPEITILKITIPPGVQLPLHDHPFINAGVLLAGELTVITENNKTLHLKAGDAIVEVVDTWHYGKNDGDEPAEIIVFYAGIIDMPVTVKELD